MTTNVRLDPLDRLRARVLHAAVEDGHTGVESPDLCLFRTARVTQLTKLATFGVSVGVVLNGSKRMQVGGSTLVASAQQLIVVTRDAETMALELTPDANDRYLGLTVMFSPDRVAKVLVALAEAGAPSSDDVAAAFAMPLEATIVDALDRLFATLDDPLDRSLIAPLVLDELLFRLLRSDAAAAIRAGVGTAQDARRILEAMQFIRANHTKKLSVETLAKKVAMSASHFAHRFTAVARTSPMRYVREVRLDRARQLMTEPGARAGDVATRVGFESAAHFAREFKRRYGVPPTRYVPRPNS